MEPAESRTSSGAETWVSGLGPTSPGGSADPAPTRPEVGLPTPVVLQLPADAGYIRLARLLASGVATRLGLPVERVQDLRVAVDEGCATLVEAGRGGSMTIEFAVVDGALVVSGQAASGGPIDEERLRVSRQILDVIADEHDVRQDNGTIHVRIVRGLDVPRGS